MPNRRYTPTLPLTDPTPSAAIRDFAYVARDRVTRKHMCHVFRCDTPARVISNTLRDICKKIMIERSLAQGAGRLSDQGTWVMIRAGKPGVFRGGGDIFHGGGCFRSLAWSRPLDDMVWV